MSQPETREVCVLSDFRDRDGTDHQRGSTFQVAYANERQRRAVNELIHRGFLTFEVAKAQKHLANQAKEAKKQAIEEQRKKSSGEQGR